jgi:hypothetical protein
VKKFAIKKSIMGALDNAAHSTNLSMLQGPHEQPPTSTTSRNKSAIDFGLHRVTAAMKQSFGEKQHSSSLEKRPSQHASFIANNDTSMMMQQ